MGNKELTEESSKDKAHRMIHLLPDDLNYKISIEKERRVLEELKTLAYQKNKLDLMKTIESRLQTV